MKLSKLLMIALLAGTLGVLGCDSDSSNPGGSGGTAGTGGTGGVNPEELCDFEFCAQDSDLGRAAKAACIDEINDCIATGTLTTEECIAFGTETCGF